MPKDSKDSYNQKEWEFYVDRHKRCTDWVNYCKSKNFKPSSYWQEALEECENKYPCLKDS